MDYVSVKNNLPMNLHFDVGLIAQYHSQSQIARLLTENWVMEHMYCPRCGNPHIRQFENNRPVADFYCPDCGNQYELKSKNGMLGHKVADGAYDTMIERITGNQNPDFFFMSYSKADYTVRSLLLIPKHFFVPAIIEKRKPLEASARRAGWVGCNIMIDRIPEQGRISIIENGKTNDSETVLQKVRASNRLETKNLKSRGWIMDVLQCVNQIATPDFSLQDIYAFAQKLLEKHPENRNIKSKIRQQLQFLRDKGFIVFLGSGQYRKL
jgi:type II restriction enzyme